MPYNEKSLKNLAPRWTTESAREAQKNSVAKRKANQEARERLAVTAAELKLDVDAVLKENDISAIGVLKIAMLKAIQEDDFDTAAELAKGLAEYEKPKLARVDQTTKDVTAEELTDEEIEQKLEQMMARK